MISIGNDIIALQQTNPDHTKQEKFYSKILCKQEVELYKKLDSNSIAFENFVWLAWSIKESIYKLYKRLHAKVLFSPTKFIIQEIQAPINIFLLNDDEHEDTSFDDDCCFCCEVIFNDETFYTRSFIKNELIFSVANTENDFSTICWGIKMIDDDVYENQSQAVRDFVLNRMQTFFPDEELSIEKAEAGYPFLNQNEDVAVSFSHHGKYVAYSFELNGLMLQKRLTNSYAYVI